MCGIAGIINKNTIVDSEVLDDMLQYLGKRGPDYVDKMMIDNIGLAHSRLSIIDLSSAANQPLFSYNATIVFNGEIYNFIKLRQQLEQLGFSFKTRSDTEVIIVGYRAWGIVELLQKLDGMFAFALYDFDTKTMHLARDPFGKKPLYYYKDSEVFLFSSDIRSIWGLKKNKCTLNHNALNYYLIETNTPQPLTIWREIEQVPPSSYISIDENLQQNKIAIKQYDSIELSDSYLDCNLNEAIDMTEQLIIASIKKRTISDVPISCFLSGGVDSGLIVALLAQNTSQVNTYTVGFKGELADDNELSNARQVAKRYATNHTELILDCNITELLPKLVDNYGEPFADISMIPSYMICQAMSLDFKVALSGDGGDELFGGYENYNLSYHSEHFLKSYPNPLVRTLVTALSKIHSRFDSSAENYGSYQHFLGLGGAQRINRNIGFDFDVAKKICSSNFKEEGLLYSKQYLDDLWSRYYGKVETSRFAGTRALMRASLMTRLLNDYLVKVDRSSMMNSLEVRSPFLDKELAQFALNLSPELLFHNKIPKYILKILARKHVNKNIFSEKKRGFAPLLSNWLTPMDIRIAKEKILNNKIKSSGLFNMKYLEKYLMDNNDLQKLFSLLSLELWMEKFM